MGVMGWQLDVGSWKRTGLRRGCRVFSTVPCSQRLVAARNGSPPEGYVTVVAMGGESCDGEKSTKILRRNAVMCCTAGLLTRPKYNGSGGLSGNVVAKWLITQDQH